MNWKKTLHEIYAMAHGLHVQDYKNCEKLEQLTNLKWKPEPIETGYADDSSARYVIKSDGAVGPSELQKAANKALFGNEEHKQPGQGFALISSDEFTALKI